MKILTELSQPLIAATGWTLIHSLWLGSICAVTASLALRTLRGAASRIRYRLACGGLIAVIGLLSLTFAFEWNVAARKAKLSRISSVESQAGPGLDQHSVDLPATERLTFGATGTLERMLPQLVVLWTAGVVLFSVRNIRAWNVVRRLRSTAENLSNAAIESRLLAFAGQLAISRPVKLLTSASLEVPVAIGWLRPVVILPLSTLSGLSPQELDAILIHELAHVSRQDYLVNLLQVAAETLLFYHPAIWWLSACIREEREDCCDDLVIALQGDRATYAKALASLEERRTFAPQLSTAATGGGLLRRIRRIANERRETKAWPIGLLTGAILCACLILFAALPNHAQAAATSRNALEFRQVLEPGSNQPGEEISVPDSGEKLKLAREVLLDAQSVLAAKVIKDDHDNPEIEIRFTEAGKQLLSTVTTANLNKRIAILHNGTVLVAPVVRSTISAGVLSMSGKFSSSDAERIAAAINESVKSETGAKSDSRNHSVNEEKSSSSSPHPRLSNEGGKNIEIESHKKNLEERSERVETLEAQLRQMRHELGLSDRAIEEPNHGKGDLIKELEREKISATLNLLDDKAKRDELQTKSRTERRNMISTLNPDPQLSALMEAENKTDQQLAALTTQAGDKNPDLVSLKTVKATILKQIDERIEGIIDGYKARVRQNQERTEKLEVLLKDARTEEISLEDRLQPYFHLKRDLEHAKIAQDNAYIRVLQEEANHGAQPGKITITGPVRNNFVALLPGERKSLFETILQAGPTEFANLKKVKLMRVDPNSGQSGEESINVEAIKTDPNKDIMVQDGDRIDIPEKKILFQEQLGKITVTGPVKNNFIVLKPGERKKLLDIVLQSDPSELAALKKVKLTRVDSNTGKNIEEIINVEAIKKDRSKDVFVWDGDHIDIPERSILFQ